MELYSHYSGKLGLICFAIWVAMLIRGRNVISGTTVQSKNYRFVFVCMLLYSVLGFLEWDTYHYYSAYNLIRGGEYNVNMERVYIWLIEIMPNSYILFRFIVWGLASLLMVLSFKRLKLNAATLAMTVPIMFLSELTNTRGSLGLALMVFCSIVFIQSLEQKKIFLVILAVLGIIASNSLHRSMFIFITITIIAYLIPFNKRLFIISLIAFPFLYSIASGQFFNSSVFQYFSEGQMFLFSNYQSQEHLDSNLNGLINVIFSKLVLLALLFFVVRKFLYQNIQTTKSEFFLFKFAYIMVYISFLFFRTDVSNWLSTRTLHAGTFALIICATRCFDNNAFGGKRNLIEKFILLGFMLTSFWHQFYFIKTYW